MATRYAHTNLIAHDWERLVAFYRDVFGCERLEPTRDLAGGWLERGTRVRAAHIRGAHLLLPGHGRDGPTLEIFQYDEVESAAGTVSGSRQIVGIENSFSSSTRRSSSGSRTRRSTVDSTP